MGSQTSLKINIVDNKSGNVVGIIYDKDIRGTEQTSRFFESLNDILDELYAYRMLEYSRAYLEAIKKGKDTLFAEALAAERVSSFDKILNYVVTGVKK